MNTRNLLSFFKKSAFTTGVGAICGMIGYIEGAISGGTGAAILGHTVKDAAIMGATGVGLLGAGEGLVLGAAGSRVLVRLLDPADKPRDDGVGLSS